MPLNENRELESEGDRMVAELATKIAALLTKGPAEPELHVNMEERMDELIQEVRDEAHRRWPERY
jgi:hypothetical protein